jgi:hypothetical protein
MRICTNCTELKPANGRTAAVLMTLLLVTASTDCAAQAPTAAPNSAIMWVQEDSAKNRYVYYIENGAAKLAGQLAPIATATTGAAVPQTGFAVSAAICVFTPIGRVC